MRVFQNNGLSRGFRSHRPKLSEATFTQQISNFLDSRFAALHILLPVLEGDPLAFYTNGDDDQLQNAWARERGLRTGNLAEILLAQIEEHNAEVFYNLDPILYGSDIVRRLPGCVRQAICWRAAPSGNVDLTAYDLVVCNFPSILRDWERRGCRTAYFVPAYDPEMSSYAGKTDRSLDLVFVGGFSRHHFGRAAALKEAASLEGIRMSLHLEEGRLARLANAFPFVPVLREHAYPRRVREFAAGPLYGREMYAQFANSRIVLNGAVDIAGSDRGNMRCFEAAGCGSVLLTDAGHYPDGFINGKTMVTYSSPDEIPALVRQLLSDPAFASSIAQAGHNMVQTEYSKQRQWIRFQELMAG